MKSKGTSLSVNDVTSTFKITDQKVTPLLYNGAGWSNVDKNHQNMRDISDDSLMEHSDQ